MKDSELIGCKVCWLVVSTHLKNISQNGSLPPSRGENKNSLKPPASIHLSRDSKG